MGSSLCNLYVRYDDVFSRTFVFRTPVSDTFKLFCQLGLAFESTCDYIRPSTN